MLTILLVAIIIAILLPMLGITIDMRIVAAALLIILLLFMFGEYGGHLSLR